MCLIIARPTGCNIPLEWMYHASEHNPHGFGIMSAMDGAIKIKKGINSPRVIDALNLFSGIHDVFIHLRYATQGHVSTQNCHPFTICNDRYAVMHNGTIDIPCTRYAGRSDTYHFCKETLEPILSSTPDAFETDEFPGALGNLIGGNGKMVILRYDGRSIIVNRHAGVETDGLWISNRYSINPPVCNKWEEQNPLGLDELASMDIESLTEFLALYPEEAARAIQSYFYDWVHR